MKRYSLSQIWRIAFQIILAMAAMVLLLYLCLESVMPLPGAAVLSVGIVASAALFLFRRPRFGAVVALSTLATVYWLVQPVVTIRPATATDPTRDRYFGIRRLADLDIDSPNGIGPIAIRNFAVARGVLNPHSRFYVRLCNVKKGKIRELNAMAVGRSGSREGPIWQKTTYILALGEQSLPGWRSTQIGIVGHSRGGGQIGDPRHRASTKAAKFLPVRLTPGKASIIYVEGDNDFVAASSMSLNDFATRNQGDYLVVEVELH